MTLRRLLILLTMLSLTGCGDVTFFPSTNGNNNGGSAATPTLTAAFTPKAVQGGIAIPNLNFTITNATGNPAQTGLGFTANLPVGLSISGAVTASQCGGTVTNIGGTQIVFSGGSLTAGTASCNVSVPLTTQQFTGTSGTDIFRLFTTTAADVSAITGSLQNSLTTQTLTTYPVSVQDSTGKVIATNVGILTCVQNATDTTKLDCTIQYDASNSNTFDVTTLNVTAVAVDKSGNDLPETSVTFVNGAVAAGTTTAATVGQNVVITLPTSDPTSNIDFWRILTVAVL